MTGSQMRAGGAGSRTAEAFDEEVEFLAATMSAGFGATSGSASVSFLAKDLDRALPLFFEMLRTPRFQADRLDLLKTQQLQAIERRNDSTDDIESREWTRLMRGDAHFTTAFITKASTEARSRTSRRAVCVRMPCVSASRRASALTRSMRRAQRRRWAPCAANASAQASPMPALAPVMKTVVSLRLVTACSPKKS
jgi:hypothetical protein